MGSKPTYEELERKVHGLKQRIIEFGHREKLLKENTEKFRLLYEKAPIAFQSLDENGFIKDVNQAWLDILGYSRDEVIGKSFEDFLKNEWIDHFKEHFPRFKDAGEILGVEFGMLKKNGSPLLALFIGKILRDENNNFIRTHCIFHDITMQRKAEKAFIENEKLNTQILKNIPNPIMVVKPDTSIKYVNPALEKITGYTSAELINKTIPYPWWNRDRISEHENGFLLLIKKKIPSIESQFRNKEDDPFWVEVRSTPLKFMNGFKYYLFNWTDITQRKKVEEEKERLEIQFWQAQKMESLGTLAGGVAHDFNNILMSIQGNASLISYGIMQDHPHRDALKNIEESVQSGARLTQQLLGFARKGKYNIDLADLNELVNNQTRMFGRTKKEITIHEKYEERIWAVEIDRGYIEQVLMNIYVNAWQAMPDGGELYVETENIVIDDESAVFYQIEPGRYVSISIRDTGIGMDTETQQKIFEPFFTTKESKGGTGLGLASAYGIIRNHGGHISVVSELGKGSAFYIYLPVSNRTDIRKEIKRKDIKNGTETVLLIDDEEGIIRVGKRLLEKLGYNVIIVGNGKDAVEVVKRTKDTAAAPDLVILDMIMPGMNGSEVFNKIKNINPEIKIILSSGYDIEGRASEIMEKGCESFIQKPFDLSELSQKIREVLD